MNFKNAYNLHKVKSNLSSCNYDCEEGIINFILKNNNIIIKNIVINLQSKLKNENVNIINELINYIIEDQYFENLIINDYIYINLTSQNILDLNIQLYTDGIKTITNVTNVLFEKNGLNIKNTDIKDTNNQIYFIITIEKSYSKFISKLENEWSDLWFEKMSNANLRLVWNLIDSSNISLKKLNKIILEKRFNSILFSTLCKNSNITMEFIKNNAENINFNYHDIFKGKLLTYNMIKKNENMLFDGCSKKRIKDYFDVLCQNPNITMKDIQENPDKFNCLRNLSRNPNITWEFI